MSDIPSPFYLILGSVLLCGVHNSLWGIDRLENGSKVDVNQVLVMQACLDASSKIRSWVVLFLLMANLGFSSKSLRFLSFPALFVVVIR